MPTPSQSTVLAAMTHHHHHHLQAMESLGVPPSSFLPGRYPADRRWKPSVDVAPNCPRCDSTNTKFCYYNNYSLAQPRYFCKSCRRYWTKGGSLRNVPVGGGCRKNRRGKPLRLSAPSLPSPSPSPDPPRRPDEPPRPSPSDINLSTLYARFLNPSAPPPSAAEGGLPDLPDLGAPWAAAPPPLPDHLAFGLDATSICDLDSIIADESLWQTSWPSSAVNAAPALPGLPPIDNDSDPSGFLPYLPGGAWCGGGALFDSSGYEDLAAQL